jgi:hypothetical protein
LRMPFLIRYPQEIQAGTVIDELVSNIDDIGPTLMDYDHVFWQHEVVGRSDLQNDPAEMNNIYGDPASTAIIEEAKQRLFAIKRTVGDDDSAYPELLERLMQFS